VAVVEEARDWTLSRPEEATVLSLFQLWVLLPRWRRMAEVRWPLLGDEPRLADAVGGLERWSGGLGYMETEGMGARPAEGLEERREVAVVSAWLAVGVIAAAPSGSVTSRFGSNEAEADPSAPDEPSCFSLLRAVGDC
jgi:hypothetical protein